MIIVTLAISSSDQLTCQGCGDRVCCHESALLVVSEKNQEVMAVYCDSCEALAENWKEDE